MLLMFRGFDDQGPYNWRRLWESNRKSCLRDARALSSSPSLPGTMSIPPFTSNSFEVVAMSKQSDKPIVRRSIPSLASEDGEKTGGTNKTGEGVARSC